MSNFSQIYPSLKPSIVAIAAKLSKNPQMPDIIGTGFIVRRDGVIFTNQHVMQAIQELPRQKDIPDEEWSASVLLYSMQEEGMASISLEIDGGGILRRHAPSEGYNYGPDVPDIAILRVKAKNLPALKISEKFTLSEGDPIMTSGFPLGTDLLTSHGWLHQAGPTLRQGIVGGLLPFPCEDPHALILDSMIQGGASGSPVFNPENGEVVGIMYGGMEGTNLSYAIPSNILSEIFNKLDEGIGPEGFEADNYETIETILKERKKQIVPPKTLPQSEFVPIEEVEFPSS